MCSKLDAYERNMDHGNSQLLQPFKVSKSLGNQQSGTTSSELVPRVATVEFTAFLKSICLPEITEQL